LYVCYGSARWSTGQSTYSLMSIHSGILNVTGNLDPSLAMDWISSMMYSGSATIFARVPSFMEGWVLFARWDDGVWTGGSTTGSEFARVEVSVEMIL
jgi:hypothetical protein